MKEREWIWFGEGRGEIFGSNGGKEILVDGERGIGDGGLKVVLTCRTTIRVVPTCPSTIQALVLSRAYLCITTNHPSISEFVEKFNQTFQGPVIYIFIFGPDKKFKCKSKCIVYVDAEEKKLCFLTNFYDTVNIKHFIALMLSLSLCLH